MSFEQRDSRIYTSLANSHHWNEMMESLSWCGLGFIADVLLMPTKGTGTCLLVWETESTTLSSIISPVI